MHEIWIHYESPLLGPPKKLLCCPHPTKIWKLGRSVRIFFFFFTYRERVEFSNIFLKVSKWGKLGQNAVKTHTSHASAFLSHWIQILANSSPKSDIKKKRPCFFAFYGRSGEGNINIFFFGLMVWLFSVVVQSPMFYLTVCNYHGLIHV